MHVIPDDGRPHAVTTECGCGPVLIDFEREDGSVRPAFEHQAGDDVAEEPCVG